MFDEARFFARDPDGSIPAPRELEDSSAFCRRLFAGRTFECRRCGALICWMGVCDGCDRALEAQWRREAAGVSLTCEQRLEESGMDPVFRRWTWKGVSIPENLNKGRLRAWVGDWDPPLMLVFGPTGSGKTGFAACMAQDHVRSDGKLRWVYVPDWLSLLHHLATSEGGTPYREIRELATFSGLVVLDEIVTQHCTDARADWLLAVLDARLRAERPTLVTSNLEPVAEPRSLMTQKLGERVVSRLRSGQIVKWAGRDRRCA